MESSKEGENTKKEFKSELARRVSQRGSMDLPKKSSVLAIAVATSALVLAMASYGFAENSTSGQPMTEYVIFSSLKDPLLEPMDAEDDASPLELLATRTMNLKVKGDHLLAGPNCPMLTAKFVYVMNVVIISDNFDREGEELGKLTIPVVASDGLTPINLAQSDLTPSAVVCDGSGVPVVSTVAAVSALTDAGIEVSVCVPELTDTTDEFGNPVDVTYESGYTISVSLAFNVSVDLNLLVGLEISEVAWADEATVNTALIGP